MTRLRARRVFQDAKRTLIAVGSVAVRSDRTAIGCHVFGELKPVALVVCGADGIYAVDMQARATDIDRLRRQVPEVDELLRASDGGGD